MNIETKCFKILAVVTFVNHQILFKVHDLNIEFSQTNLHIDPNRDDGNQKTEETVAGGCSDHHTGQIENGSGGCIFLAIGGEIFLAIPLFDEIT